MVYELLGGNRLGYKKTIGIILCLLLITWSFPVTASTKEVIVNENYLNLRSGPGTNYDKLGQVHQNEQYPIVGQEGDWVEIQLDGYTAWISTDYVTIQEDSSEQQVKNVGLDHSVDQTSITIPFEKTHIRNGPSTDDEIIYFAEKGETLSVIGKTDNWLKVKNDTMEGYVLADLVKDEIKETSEGLKGKTIVLDPGHGGFDSGAISPTNVLEKDLAYKTADILAQELTMLGAIVITTREEDTFASLASRATLSNTVHADAFISLHYNSVPDLPTVTGISTYYSHEQYAELARYMQQEIIKESGDRDRGAEFGDFQVIRQNLMPAVLIELGFMSNPEMDTLMTTNAYQKKLVSGIVNGLQRYFSN